MGLGREAGETKYYPPTFDPALLPKPLSKKGPQQVRMMMPVGVQCLNCGEWIPENKKFAAIKEKVEGETYLGLTIFRLIIKCPRCSNEIALKTDLEHYDYNVEYGASKNYQHYKAVEKEAAAEAAKKAETAGDTLAAHNRKVIDATREMSQLEQLEELQHRAAQSSKLTDEQLLRSIAEKHTGNAAKKEEDDERDRKEAEALFSRQVSLDAASAVTASTSSSIGYKRPVSESEPAVSSGPDVLVVKKQKKEKKKKKEAGFGLDY